MNVIHFLMLLFALFIVVRVIQRAFSLVNPKLLHNTSKELSHENILKILTNMGHPEFEGVCFGFTVNWALSIAEGKEKFFYQQLQLLRKYQNNLMTVVHNIQLKQGLGFSLTEEELCILTLPDLCKRICYAQSPLNYKSIYGNFVWQADINPILRTISQPSSNAELILTKTHTFVSTQNARDYFNELIRLGISKKIAVIISTPDHAMGFKRSKNGWRFLNINDLFKQNTEQPYFKLNTNDLVDMLYEVGTEDMSPQRLTISTEFVGQHDPTTAQKLKPLTHQYPVVANEINHSTYRDRLKYISLAAQGGDITTVKACINAGWSIFSKRHSNAHSPIFTAIQVGRRDVAKAMLSAIQHRINFKIKKSQSTLLHEACKYPNSGIVEDILNVPGIIIDNQDKNKRTPLMIVCGSYYTNEDPSVLKLLLSRNASLTIKDINGLTALDYAEQHLNWQARQIIHSHIQNQTPKPANTVSQVLGFFSLCSRKKPNDTKEAQLIYR